jgi:hypothetical protein
VGSSPIVSTAECRCPAAVRLDAEFLNLPSSSISTRGTTSVPVDSHRMSDTAWNETTRYLRLLGAGNYETATDLLVAAIDSEGEGAVVDALADCCRALMQRITYSAGVVDVRAAVADVADRVVMAVVDTRADAIDDIQTLLVFLGSEGLPCRARTVVASWTSTDRVRNLVACAIGLVATVANEERRSRAAVAEEITRPGPPKPARGTFDLAGLSVQSAGVAARVAFVAEEPASLRAILARVALLRYTTDDREVAVDLGEHQGLGEMLRNARFSDRA